MARQQYWVVSPNVKDDRTKDQETVKQWKEVIRRDRVAIMGWSPEDYERGHGVGPKFAYDLQKGDIVLIARRKNWEPETLGFGKVSRELRKEEDKYREIYDQGPVYVRRLGPFIELHEAPRGIPFHDVLNCTWAMHQLHPDRDNSARKVCAWMDQQLELANREDNSGEIREKPWDEPGTKTYDYEVRTKGQTAEARRTEAELLDSYEQWLKTQARKLSKLQIGRKECDAWEAERRNLIEAKGTISRQDIRMAVGQLLDYAYQMRKDLGDPNKAVLLPEKPDQSDVGWLESVGIHVIWRSDRKFQDDAGGQFV
jgi:hypothetical protein